MDKTQRDRMFSGERKAFESMKPDAGIKYNAPRIYEMNMAREMCGDDHDGGWSRENLYRVVLSELGRFPKIDEKLFIDLAAAAKLTPGKHRDGKDIFCRLLSCENVGFTIATAILKFLNPEVFQTLNAHSGQVVMGDSLPPSRFSMDDYSSYIEAASEYYFKYLDKLHELTGDELEFRNADILLGQVDKLMSC